MENDMVYAIRNDGYNFQELHLEIDDIIDNFPEDIGFHEAHDFSTDNLSMSDWWKPVDTFFAPIEEDEDTPVPDIAKWINATLVLSPKAFAAIGEVLTRNGELLPIKIADQTFHIFNCLTSIDVDSPRCEKAFYEGEEIGWKTIAFKEFEVTQNIVFKSRDQGCLDLFCGDELKSLIEKHQLKGVAFDQSLIRSFD